MRMWLLMSLILLIGMIQPLMAGSALLTWIAPTENDNGTPLQDLAGHKAYWGTSSGNYSTEVDVGLAISASFSGLPDGQTIYFATKAYDSSGNHSIFSAEVSKVMPRGDTTPPTVSITSPTNGATVPRKQITVITATASDETGISFVTFKVNGAVKCTDSSAPYTCQWTVLNPPHRTYTVQATATDAAHNVGTSATIQVTSQ
jgi:Bacterial Ig domain